MIYKLLFDIIYIIIYIILYYLFIYILNNSISMSISVCFSRGLIRRRWFLPLQWILIVFKPESWSSGRNHRRSNYRSRRPCSEPRASNSHARKHLYDFMFLYVFIAAMRGKYRKDCSFPASIFIGPPSLSQVLQKLCWSEGSLEYLSRLWWPTQNLQ